MMRQLIDRVGMGADGKPMVTVSSEDPEAAAQAIPWDKQTYARMATARMAQEPEQHRADAPTEQPPTCQVHNTPMIGVNVKRGLFWSCHAKNPDGTWCSYRPPKL